MTGRPPLRLIPAPRPRCQFCEQHTDGDLFAASLDERHWICANCVAGAVLMFEREGVRVVPQSVLQAYGCRPQCG